MGMLHDLKREPMIGRNERRKRCQQGSGERGSKVRKEVDDNRDTVNEISLTQCTQYLPEGSSTIMCKCSELGGVVAGQ
jgi:hypothetical protein